MGSPVTIEQSCWADLPPDLLRDVIKRLEASESTWPSRKHVVACAAVCRAWREMCKEIVRSPQFCGKLTFPVSLKQPGPRDGTIQCFIRRDKSKLTYHLYLCTSPAVSVENGKLLLSAEMNCRTSCTEFIICMDAENISRSSSTYIGKLRSNFLGTKFIISDTQPPYNGVVAPSPPGRLSSRFYWKKVSPKVPSGSYSIAEVAFERKDTGTRVAGRKLYQMRMHCLMHSIPVSSLEPGGTVPLEDSFHSTAFSKSSPKDQPLVLRNKAPRWDAQQQCWWLNFGGRVTVSSAKNFQLIAATAPPAGAPTPPQPAPADHDKVILQFGKVAKDMFTMDYCYPLSAFQAFAICLSCFGY